MTEQQIYQRCNALGVCDDLALHTASGDWYYDGSYMQIEHAHAAIEKRLAEKVREKYPSAYCLPPAARLAGHRFCAKINAASFGRDGDTELEAWLLLAESLFGAPAAPHDAETKPATPSPYVNHGPYPDKREPTSDELRAARERHAANAKPAEPDRSVPVGDKCDPELRKLWCCAAAMCISSQSSDVRAQWAFFADRTVIEYRARFGPEARKT